MARISRNARKLIPADDWTTVAEAMQLFEVDPESWSMLENLWRREDIPDDSPHAVQWDRFNDALTDATKVMERHAGIQWSRAAS